MFEALSESLESAWKSLRGQAKISESNIQEALRDVRRSLLEADANLQVVKDFIEEVRETALGAEVIKGVSPDQQFIKIVNDELIKVMGETNAPLAEANKAPTVILMAGLQGTGKTTATAKLALHLRKQDRSALLVATDVYRPAAIDQLVTLGKQINVPVFEIGADANPVEIARQGLAAAREQNVDTVIIDTAGRLQNRSDLMQELEKIVRVIRKRDESAPHNTLLVLDATTGQNALSQVEIFQK
ncbi:MAG: signal recognition particle receptor subunit alpha, partial [Cyanobacteria bacterium P01_A01_bin.17]